MWHINDDGAIPPLPQEIVPAGGKGCRTSLKPGCWVVRLDPMPADDFNAARNQNSRLRGWTVAYLGTLRVNLEGEGIRASGDLYLQRQDWSRKGPAMPPPLPRPREIPIFRRQAYSDYFTLKSIQGDFRAATIAIYRFNSTENSWGPEEVLSATVVDLERDQVPAGWKKGNYLLWSIRNDRGTVVAQLQMGWVSKYLRRAKIDIACAVGINPPIDDGNGLTLKEVFKGIGWKVEKPVPVLAQGPAEVWAERDLHAKMLELRRAADLDSLWTYHVLVVPRWQESEEFGFGRMYDVGAVDSNLVPREGLVVAATARFPADKERFGSAHGQQLRDVPQAAFHNLLHELGHAMGLLHRYYGRGLMQALIYIADQATTPPFPDNLTLAYDPEDVVRLRHYPDMWTRPGGVPFGQGYSALPVPDADAITDVSGQFDLKVKPLLRKVPLGAPVKLQLRLTNISRSTLPGPALLSLSYGSVAGRVVGPGGQIQVFSGAAPIDFGWTADLAPGSSIYNGETLLRGPQGALFPEPGLYRIEVDAGWVGPGGIARITTSCEVRVAPPRNRRHKRVARDLLAARGLSILLIFRPYPGSENQLGNEAVAEAVAVLQRALETPELRDIFAPSEARRLAESDLRGAAQLIEETGLMTTSEIEHLLKIAKEAEHKIRQFPEVRRMIEICRAKAHLLVAKNFAPQSLLDRAEELLRCC